METEILNTQMNASLEREPGLVETQPKTRGRGRPKNGEIVIPKKKYIKRPPKPPLTEEQKRLRTLEYSRKQRREHAEDCRITHRVYYYRLNYGKLFTNEEFVTYRPVIDKYAAIKIAISTLKDENPELLPQIMNRLFNEYLKSNQENEGSSVLSNSTTSENKSENKNENDNENDNENFLIYSLV